METQKSIDVLQFFITNLNAQAFSHKLQAKIFGSIGLKKLEEKYSSHAEEESGYVDEFITRLINLGGKIKQEAVAEQPLYDDAVAYIKADHQVSIEGIEYLRNCMESVKDDYTTLRILEKYLKDEEDDMYWQEEQLNLIEKIGVENWLMKIAI